MKTSKLFLLISAAFLLAGCDSKANSNASGGDTSDSDTNTGGSGTSGGTIIDGDLWSDEVKAHLISKLGETIPYAPFDEESFDYGYDTSDDCWYAFDDNLSSIFDGYETKLLGSGYEAGVLEGEDEDYDAYFKTTANGSEIALMFGWSDEYYDEDYGQTIPAGNEIDVYVLSKGQGGGGGGEGDVCCEIDFSDSSTYSETHDDDSGEITAGQYTISVERNVATVAVGNGQWPDSSTSSHFRFYLGQQITITWSGSAPSTIDFNCTGSSNDIDSSTDITGGTVDNSVSAGHSVITVTGNSVSFVVTGHQLRVLTLTFNA